MIEDPCQRCDGAGAIDEFVPDGAGGVKRIEILCDCTAGDELRTARAARNEKGKSTP